MKIEKAPSEWRGSWCGWHCHGRGARSSAGVLATSSALTCLAVGAEPSNYGIRKSEIENIAVQFQLWPAKVRVVVCSDWVE